MLRPAASMSSIELIERLESTSASGMFGVSRVAIGSKRLQNVPKASSCMSIEPLVDTITGSTTSFCGEYSCSVSAIARIVAWSFTMPTFIAVGFMSSITARICPATISGCMA